MRLSTTISTSLGLSLSRRFGVGFILSCFHHKKWGDAHACSVDCHCRRIFAPARRRTRTGVRKQGSLCQGRHRRLLRGHEEEGQKAEGESGVYARGPDEVSPLPFSRTSGPSPRSSP